MNTNTCNLQQPNPTKVLFHKMMGGSYEINDIIRIGLYELSNIKYNRSQTRCGKKGIISFTITEIPITNPKENTIIKFKSDIMFSNKQVIWDEINIQELQKMAIDYIFDTCFDVFYNEGYLKCWDDAHNEYIKIWSEWNIDKYLHYSKLSLSELEFNDGSYEFDNEFRGGFTYFNYYALKHYKKYLNGPLIEFLQLVSRINVYDEMGYLKQHNEYLIASRAIRAEFRKRMEAKLGYKIEYDNEFILYHYHNDDKHVSYSGNLDYGCYNTFDIPVKITLSHYICKYGNNIAIELFAGNTWTKEGIVVENDLWEIGVDIKNNYTIQRHIKMNWIPGDAWVCVIPVRPLCSKITYKFVELDENNHKIREEPGWITINLVEEHKFSNFATSRNWINN